MTLRLLSYNIRYGGRGREAELAAVIRSADPDVVLLQEATDRGVVERLSELTGLPNWDSRPRFSTGYLTRREVIHHDWHLPRWTRHAFLELALAGPELRIFGLHLSAWFSNWSEWRRRFEIRSLLYAIREHQHGVHFIAGDFNALAPGEVLKAERMPQWIRAMVWLSGQDIARHTIQHMIDQHYVDAWRIAHPTGEGYTFPTWDPHVRLDYIFTPERYQSSIRACDVLNRSAVARTASDHFALLVELDLASGAAAVDQRE
ncbi:MAG: endonuclease/exonuclease/phosphatase family protein [Gemmatimonadota bacterium]